MAKMCKQCGALLGNDVQVCPHCGEEVYGRNGRIGSAPIIRPPVPVTPPPAPVTPPPAPVTPPPAPVTPPPAPVTPPPAPVTPPPAPSGENTKSGGKQTISEKKVKKAAKKGKKKKKSSILILIVSLVLLLILGGCTLVVLDACDIIDIPFIGSNETDEPSDAASTDIELDDEIPEDYTVPTEDAGAYFDSNSQVLAVVDAATSPNVQTEAQVVQDLNTRGFVDQPITSNYNLSGEYSDSVEVSSSSGDKHPIYMTYYACANGQIWTIFSINGTVMAKPVSYMLDHSDSVEILLSETGSLTSYDGPSNKFYETIPNASEVIVKTVPKINAETLENLDYGAIDAL